jgi:hypothetical protein
MVAAVVEARETRLRGRVRDAYLVGTDLRLRAYRWFVVVGYGDENDSK